MPPPDRTLAAGDRVLRALWIKFLKVDTSGKSGRNLRSAPPEPRSCDDGSRVDARRDVRARRTRAWPHDSAAPRRSGRSECARSSVPGGVRRRRMDFPEDGEWVDRPAARALEDVGRGGSGGQPPMGRDEDGEACVRDARPEGRERGGPPERRRRTRRCAGGPPWARRRWQQSYRCLRRAQPVCASRRATRPNRPCGPPRERANGTLTGRTRPRGECKPPEPFRAGRADPAQVGGASMLDTAEKHVYDQSPH